MSDAIWRRRLASALCIVLVPIACLGLADTHVKAAEPAPASNAQPNLIDAQQISSASGALAMLGQLENLAESSADELPAGFEEEVGLPSLCEDVRVDPSGSVVGCSLRAGADEALAQVRLLMKERGWREVPLGGIEGATFAKDGGRYSWMLVTCTQTGSSSEIVYRSVKI